MRTLTALLILVGVVVFATAQDTPKTGKLSVYGQSSLTAVNALEESLELHAVYHEVESDELNSVCFVTAKAVSQDDATELVSFATGYQIVAEPERGVLHVGVLGEPAGRGKVKGYDVSVLGGRYVEYVNTWGAPRNETPANEAAEPERTAAQHLAELIEEVLYDPWSEECRASVVGDRVLFTLQGGGHQRVRELLDLLLGETGGESQTLQRERGVIQKLKSTSIETAYEATPVSSVLADICLESGVGLALGPDIAAISVEYHVDLSLSGVTAWKALQLVLDLLEQDQVDVGSRAGAVAIEVDTHRIGCGYQVYNIEKLLKKLDASYQRQRTQSGKEEGYTGGLREEGGNRVVVDSLYDLLEAGKHYADCFVYGSRLVVKGNAEAVDAATEILVQMGWEKPKD